MKFLASWERSKVRWTVRCILGAVMRIFWFFSSLPASLALYEFNLVSHNNCVASFDKVHKRNELTKDNMRSMHMIQSKEISFNRCQTVTVIAVSDLCETTQMPHYFFVRWHGTFIKDIDHWATNRFMRPPHSRSKRAGVAASFAKNASVLPTTPMVQLFFVVENLISRILFKIAFQWSDCQDFLNCGWAFLTVGQKRSRRKRLKGPRASLASLLLVFSQAAKISPSPTRWRSSRGPLTRPSCSSVVDTSSEIILAECSSFVPTPTLPQNPFLPPGLRQNFRWFSRSTDCVYQILHSLSTSCRWRSWVPLHSAEPGTIGVLV